MPVQKNNDSIAGITDFVFLEDSPERADVILVPGSSRPHLMDKACELYLNGYAPFILPSGGHNDALGGFETEWDYCFDIARKHGIPDSAIIREDKAANTFENARFSRIAADGAKIKTDTAIIVCKAFHARRCLMTYQVEFGARIRYIMIPVADERNILKNNWYLDPLKTAKVMNEVEKTGSYFVKHIPALVSADSKKVSLDSEPFLVEIGNDYIPSVSKLKQAFTRERQRFSSQSGIPLDKVRIIDNQEIEPRSYRFKVKGTVVFKAKRSVFRNLFLLKDFTKALYSNAEKIREALS